MPDRGDRHGMVTSVTRTFITFCEEKLKWPPLRHTFYFFFIKVMYIACHSCHKQMQPSDYQSDGCSDTIYETLACRAKETFLISPFSPMPIFSFTSNTFFTLSSLRQRRFDQERLK